MKRICNSHIPIQHPLSGMLFYIMKVAWTKGKVKGNTRSLPCISFVLSLGYVSLTYHSHQRHLPCGGASDALFARNEWRVALTTSMCQEVDAVKKQHRNVLYAYIHHCIAASY